MTFYSNQRMGRVVRVLAILLIVVFLVMPALVRAQETPKGAVSYTHLTLPTSDLV